MRRILVVLVMVGFAVVGALAASTPAPGHATSLWLAVGSERGTAETLLDSETGDASAEREAQRVIVFSDKALRSLTKALDASSYVKELKLTGKAVKLIEKKLLPLDRVSAALGDAVDATGDRYADDLVLARDRLAAAAAGGGRKASRVRRALRRADKSLQKANGAATRVKRFKALLALAKATKGFSRDGEISCGASGKEATWVISGLRMLSESETAPDLTGDGKPDDALGALLGVLGAVSGGIDADDVNALLSERLLTGAEVVVLQGWGLRGSAPDDCAQFGLLNAADTDGDPDDNFSGSEVFDPGDALAADGYAPTRGSTAIRADGAFVVDLEVTELVVAQLPLAPTGRLLIAGTYTGVPPQGVIGIVIDADDLVAFVTDLGLEIPPAFLPLVGQTADVDVDGDGKNDSFSLALAFTTVPCELSR